MRVECAYGGGRGQARDRLRALGEYLSNRHGIGVRWVDDDHAVVSGKYVMFSFEGKMAIDEGRVVLEGPDPGFVLRGKAREYLERKLAKYLDPATPIDALPRR